MRPTSADSEVSADRPAGALEAERRLEEGDLVGDEADLRQQAQREGADHGEIARLAQQVRGGSSASPVVGRGRRFVADVVLVGAARPQHDGARAATASASTKATAAMQACGEAHACRSPRRRPARTAARRRWRRSAPGWRPAAPAVEPLRDDGVDRAAAHRGPARDHDREGEHRAARARSTRVRPSTPSAHQAGADQHHRPRAALLDDVAHLHHQEGAGDVIEGDGRGDRRRRPARPCSGRPDRG